MAAALASPIAIGFDLGDTLLEYVDVPLNWIEQYPAALALVAGACSCELTPARLQSGTELLLRYNTRTTPRVEEWEYSADYIFHELLLAWQLPREHLARAVSAFFAFFSAKVRAFPEAAAVLRDLQQHGVPIAVLTDVPYGMPVELVRADLAQAGLVIAEDLFLTSTMVGHRKPHRAGFGALAQRLGVACSELLYVGNEHKDIAGGKAAGCSTALVWRVSGEPPAWGQDLTIGSLDELRKLSFVGK